MLARLARCRFDRAVDGGVRGCSSSLNLPELREVVDRSIQTDPHRQEYTKIGRTIAEMFMDQGEQRGELKQARSILLRQLRKRFKKVPRKIEARIAAATEIRELETWLDSILDAKTLAEVGIPLD